MQLDELQGTYNSSYSPSHSGAVPDSPSRSERFHNSTVRSLADELAGGPSSPARRASSECSREDQGNEGDGVQAIAPGTPPLSSVDDIIAKHRPDQADTGPEKLSLAVPEDLQTLIYNEKNHPVRHTIHKCDQEHACPHACIVHGVFCTMHYASRDAMFAVGSSVQLAFAEPWLPLHWV